MKKVIFITLCFVMIFAFAACAKGGNEPTANTAVSAGSSATNAGASAEANSPGKTDGHYRIAFATKYLTGSTFWVQLTDAAKAAVHDGDEYILVNAQEDVALQITQIEDLIAAKYNALIVSCADTTAINPVLQEAKDDGIMVVTVDSSCTDSSLFKTEVMNDNATAAGLVGEELAKAMGYKGKAICYYDTQTDQAKTKGETVQKILEGYGIQVIHVDGLGNADEALGKIEAAIQANPDITGCHCYNGSSSEGAISALTSAGILDKVFVTTIDGSESDFNNLKNGKLLCIGTQQPAAMGKYATESVYKALAGEKLETTTLVPAYLITKDNMDQFKPF